MMMVWVALMVSSAVPADARYVMSVGGVPVGVVSYALEGSTYVYRSTQVFRSKNQEVVRRIELALGHLKPEVWWLSVKRPDGCVEVTEERSTVSELVCTRAGGGTIAGRAFRSAYGPGGQLLWLELPGVLFEASARELPARADPFAEGFAVSGEGPTPRVEPPVKGVELVHAAGVSIEAGDDQSCLELARAYVARHATTTVVLGVVIERGRAWPHAWVKTAKGEHFDPTVAPDEANPRQYLVFSRDAASLYLELLSGQRRVTRSRGRSDGDRSK